MASDFFTQQDRARRQTWLLVVLYLLAVAGIIVSVYAVILVLYFFSAAQDEREAFALLEQRWFLPELFAPVTAATAFVVALGSGYKIAQLARGGEAVALLLGGRPINADARSLQEKRILNVVEEMAIAAGVPVPPVYLLDKEEGVNAFAAGYKPSDAVIGVTKGTVELLNRDELQGVVAHEFSHILNGDMRLNIRLMGLINGLLVISVVGYYIVRSVGRGSSSRDKKGAGAAILIFGLALMLLGWVGVFFGQIIRAAVSRQREYLADASAVQFTRNPDGIAGALKKIGGWVKHARVDDPHAAEAAHIFFGQAVAVSFAQLFATHPPLEVRIRRIDPNWDGVYPKVSYGAAQIDEPPKRSRKGPFDAIPFPIDPTRIGEQAGAVGAAQLAGAAALLESLPEAVSAGAHDPYQAVALVYAMLLDPRPEILRVQLRDLEANVPRGLFEEVERLDRQVRSMPREGWLASIELLLPALKSISKPQYQAFRDNVRRLIKADSEISVFEYAAWLFVVRSLDEHFGLRRRTIRTITDAAKVRPDVAKVLGYLAWIGHQDPAAALEAYRTAWREFGWPNVEALPDRAAIDLKQFGESLDRLAAASPKIKRRLLQACAASASADRRVTLDEYELIRVVASILECPLPPAVAQPTAAS